jgi:two-component system NtrC family sensor kinase
MEKVTKALSEALAWQRATAEILRVISQSPTDVQPVFDAIADSAVRLCNAAFSWVFRFDGELIHLTAHAGLTAEELAAARRIFPVRAMTGGIGLSRVVLDRTVVHIADIRTDAEWQAAPGPHRSLDQLTGYRTFLAVPLRHDDVSLGAINVWRREVSPFSEQQTDLLKTFVDQAIIAIENVRLFKELQTRNRELTAALEQQTATRDILRVISSSPTDVQPCGDCATATPLTIGRQ